MRGLILMYVVLCCHYINGQPQNKQDSLSLENFSNFTKIISEFASKKYTNYSICYSESKIFTFDLVRVNDWTELRIVGVNTITDSSIPVVYGGKGDTMWWNLDYYYSKFITESVFDQTGEYNISKVVRDQIYITCNADDWARFYSELMLSKKKKARLYFDMDTNSTKRGYSSFRCKLVYIEGKGFKSKIAIRKSNKINRVLVEHT